MAVSTRSLGAALVAVTGADAVTRGTSTDAVDGIVPRWVVAPSAIEELGAVMGLACDEKLAVVPRGSGAAMALGYPLARADLVLDLARMGGILEYTPDDLTVTVAAGARMGAVAARLRSRGQLLPLDAPGASARTVGGLLATGATGPLRTRYGTARDLLLGVRFVQADGVVTWGGAKVVKSVTGYDIPKLMVGALGTLGVLAELTLRLHPLPSVEGTWLIAFDSADAAQGFVASVIDSSLQPNRVEWLNARAANGWGVSAGATAIAVSVGSVEEAVQAQRLRIEAHARQAGATMRDMESGFWRDHGLAGESPDGVTLRMGTLPDRVAAAVTGIEHAVSAIAPSAAVAITGSAMVGALRVQLEGASPQDGAVIVRRLRALVEPVAGSVVVERGSVEFRRAVDPWGPVAPGPFALMRAIKQQFDPQGILNSGRFVGGL